MTDTPTTSPTPSASDPTAAGANTTPPTPEALLAAIQPVIDPEIGISIVDLGLVYQAKMIDDGIAYVLMTFTTPMCPLGPEILNSVQQAVQQVSGVREVKVELTFNPPWDPRTMASDETKMLLGIF